MSSSSGYSIMSARASRTEQQHTRTAAPRRLLKCSLSTLRSGCASLCGAAQPREYAPTASSILVASCVLRRCTAIERNSRVRSLLWTLQATTSASCDSPVPRPHPRPSAPAACHSLRRFQPYRARGQLAALRRALDLAACRRGRCCDVGHFGAAQGVHQASCEDTPRQAGPES